MGIFAVTKKKKSHYWVRGGGSRVLNSKAEMLAKFTAAKFIFLCDKEEEAHTIADHGNINFVLLPKIFFPCVIPWFE